MLRSRGGRTSSIPGSTRKAAGKMRAYPQELRGQSEPCPAEQGEDAVAAPSVRLRNSARTCGWGRALPGRRPVVADSGWARQRACGSRRLRPVRRLRSAGTAPEARCVDLRVGDLPWIVADLPIVEAVAARCSR